MNSSVFLANVLFGAGIAYLIGVGISAYAYRKYRLLGDPRIAPDQAILEHFARLSRATSFRWFSLACMTIAIVLSMLLLQSHLLRLTQYWPLVIVLAIAELMAVPTLRQARKALWAVWVRRYLERRPQPQEA